jgi:hypothetical protein
LASPFRRDEVGGALGESNGARGECKRRTEA